MSRAVADQVPLVPDLPKALDRQCVDDEHDEELSVHRGAAVAVDHDERGVRRFHRIAGHPDARQGSRSRPGRQHALRNCGPVLASSRVRRILEFRRPQNVVVPPASSDEQRARVLTGVKALRFAPPPLRGASGPDAGSAHARPDWLLVTMPAHTTPTCCGRPSAQNRSISQCSLTMYGSAQSRPCGVPVDRVDRVGNIGVWGQAERLGE